MADKMTLEVEIKILEDPVKEAAENLKSKFKSLVSELNDITSGIKQGFFKASKNIVDIAGQMSPEVQEKIENIRSTWDGITGKMVEKFEGPINKILDIATNVINEICGTLSSSDVDGILERYADAIAGVIDVAGKVIDEILPYVVDGLQWIIDNSDVVIAALSGIGSGFVAFEIATTIFEVINKFKEFREAVVATEGVMEAFNIICEANPYAIIIGAIVGIVTALVVLWNTSEGFREVVTGIFKTIGEVMSSVWNELVTFFTETIPSAFQSLCDFFVGIPQWFSDLWGLILEAFSAGGQLIVEFLGNIPGWFSDLWSLILEVFSTGWQLIVDFFTEQIPVWLESIYEWFNKLPEYIGYALGYALGKVIEFGAECINWIDNDLPGIISGIIDWFGRLPGEIWNFLCDIVSKICSWGENVLYSAVNAVSTMFSNVIDWFGRLPGNIWIFLCDIVSKIGTWGQNILSSAVSAVSTMFNNVINWFSRLPGNIASCLGNVISSVVSWGSNLINSGVNAALGLVNSIVSTVSSLPGKMVSIGSNIVSGIWEGIKNATSWIKEKICEFCSGIVSGIKDALGIHSPSRIMRDLVGINIVKGIGVGFEIEMPNLNKITEGKIGDMTKRIKAAVQLESSKVCSTVVGGQMNGMLSSSITNNDNGIVQNITINQPVKSPSETARAIRRAGRDLAFG